ncbi:RraA family protein [Olivibacter domesticus]|uniref:Regulator of RNase E activity RraA n=1 Tax=Olivibacter domesticus TaxID=407022 RepID=A0A1H7Q8B2_OLID1|nr:dimethylmenaquinone methyltransferase [Olivibacter domesticus]SEL43894.1 Regulator of RNase E activity RraA [Olivibacter domesticus]
MNLISKLWWCFCLCFFAGKSIVFAQHIPKEELLFLTAEWSGARFDDGRPKIPDELITRARAIGFDDAWTILRNEGYNNQFEQGWQMLHEDALIAGRALTAMYIPSRPDVEKSILTRGHNQGKKGNTNSWPIDLLQKGDVYVADGFGKIAGGTLIGQTLGNAIFNRTGNGVVFDAAVRDFNGLKEIKGFNAFVRGFHPSFLEESMLIGINTPIRIGKAVVLPGDLVLSNKEGALFIPAHLAEKVIVTAEFIQLRDAFGNERIKSGTYSVGQIDNQWDDQIKSDFLSWLKQHEDQVKMSKTQLDELMKKRTW